MKKIKKVSFMLLFVLCMMAFPAVHAKAASGVLLINGAKQDKAAVNSLNLVKKSLDVSVWSGSKKNTYSYNYTKGVNVDKINKEIKDAYAGINSSCFFYYVGNASAEGISLKGNSVYSFKDLAKKLYSVDCFKMVVVLDTPYASKFIDAAKKIDKNGRFVIFAGAQKKIKPLSNYYRFSKAFANGMGADDYLMYGDMNHDRHITASEMNEYCTVQLGNDLLSGASMDQKCQLYAVNKNHVIAEYGVSIGSSSKSYLGTLKLNVKKSQQLYPYVLGKKGSEKKAKWSSSNQDVVSVSSTGKVTAKKAGSATITAEYGGVKATCKVEVNDKTITPSQNKSLEAIKKYTIENDRYPGKITNAQSGKLIGYNYDIHESDISISFSDYFEDEDNYQFVYSTYTEKDQQKRIVHLNFREMNSSVSVSYTRYYNKDYMHPETVYYSWKNGNQSKYTGSSSIPFANSLNLLKHYSLSLMKKEGNQQIKTAFKLWDEYLRKNVGMSLKNLGFTSLKFDNTPSDPDVDADGLNKEILEVERDYVNNEKTLNTNGDKAVKNIMRIYEDEKNESIDALSSKIKTLMASNLPAKAEKAMLKVFTDKIQDTLLVKSSSYNSCKTAPQLVNKVAEQISNEKGRFTFTSGKINYTANFKSIGVAGATFVTGTINSNNGHVYSFLGTSVSDSTIKEEMDNLKKFADSKIEEAKKAVYSDVKGILVPNELKAFLKTTTKSKIFKVLNKKYPNFAKYSKLATEMTDKFIAVKKAYDGLKSINLENTDEKKVAKAIAEYHKKVEAYDKAVEALLDIQI